nr:MAG TPA: hypothetical protein [Caudoviricetes sp.]
MFDKKRTKNKQLTFCQLSSLNLFSNCVYKKQLFCYR